MRRGLFKKPKNQLELHGRNYLREQPTIPDEMWIQCSGCHKMLLVEDLADNQNICDKCGFHFKLNARERIHFICDEDSFVEINGDLKSDNLIDFPRYDKKLQDAQLKSSENEAVVTGTATIDGQKCALFIMNPFFMMGSMGTVVGEKITRLFEYASEHRLPVIGYTVSGGARMQEGILSLMQMAKTSGAIKRHSDAGLLYIVVLTNPTTGGVTASFAMEGDIILAEPGALIAFAGPRVIEQTIRQKLPEGFQRAEFLIEKGFLDQVVPRKEQKTYLANLLFLHGEVEQ